MICDNGNSRGQMHERCERTKTTRTPFPTHNLVRMCSENVRTSHTLQTRRAHGFSWESCRWDDEDEFKCKLRDGKHCFNIDTRVLWIIDQPSDISQYTWLGFYCDDGFQKRDEFVVLVQQIFTAVLKDCCSGTTGEPRWCNTVSDILLLRYFSLTNEWWRGTGINTQTDD